MVPVRCLVARPPVVVGVAHAARRKVVCLAGGVLVGCGLQVHAFVNPVLNVVGLARNWACEHLVRFQNLFKLLFARGFLFLRGVGLKVGVTLFCELVVCELDLLLRGRRFDLEDLVQGIFIFTDAE